MGHRAFRPEHLLVPLVIILCGLTFCESADKLCHNLLPGLERLRRGIDITKLDLLPYDTNAENGFKQDVLDYHCNKGKTKHMDGTAYSVPDEVSSVIRVPRANMQTEVSVMKTSADVMKSKSLQVDVAVGFPAGSFSASASYKKMTNNFQSKDRNIEQATSFQSTATVNLVPSFALKLGKYAQMFVDNHLPNKYSDNPAKYSEFIKTFGTHYFDHAKLGGSMQLTMETKKSYFKDKSDEEVAAEAKAEFETAFVSGSVGVKGSMGTKKASDDFKSNSNKIIRSYGGNADLLTAGGMKTWLKSVIKKPWLTSGRLVKLSALIKNKEKQKSMEKATQMYTDMKYLDSLLETLSPAYTKFTKDRKTILDLMKKVKALKAAHASDHNAIISLGKKITSQVEVPSWFYSQVQLCYKWIPKGDRNQCGTPGLDYKLCANTGAMTHYYLDNTDSRRGGCQMQWGIIKQGFPKSVLHDVKLCFRFYNVWPKFFAKNKKAQCNGIWTNIKKPGEYCSSVSEFTKPYIDDTDQRTWGCAMHWKLVVPDTAPIWLRNMKMCFQYVPDGDSKQCQGGYKRLLCATANAFTKLYIDDTNNRKGGCKMRWGIHM